MQYFTMTSSSIKIVMLGNSGVGKTAFVERLSDDVFTDAHVPTIGALYVTIDCFVNGKKIAVELWDTAGQEIYRSLTGYYARNTRGCILVFDITDKKSFDDVPSWIEFLRSNSPDAHIILFGNKSDLSENRVVSTEEIEKFTKDNKITYYEGSAKTGHAISDVIDDMAETTSASLKAETSVIDLADDKEKKQCC